jgi:ABC-type sugar transport system ATPase subunit
LSNLIDIESLRFRYRRGQGDWLLDIARFAVEANEAISLHGVNMSGKTTLLHLVSGLIDESACEVARGGMRWLGRRVTLPPDPIEMKESGLRILNQSDPMFPDLSLVENIMLSSPLGYGRFRTLARAQEVLRRFEITYPDTPTASGLGSLSGGGRAMIRLLRTVAYPHRLLLLDEPTENLDDKNRTSVFRLLEELLAEKASLVLVSHSDDDHAMLNRIARTRGMIRRSLRLCDTHLLTEDAG